MQGLSIPWWGKITAKVVLSRLPLRYGAWRKLGLFRHGSMDLSSYAVEVFRTHTTLSGAREGLDGKTLLELGPGDSIATSLIAASHGARAILVDSGPYANTDMQAITRLTAQLREAGLACPDLSHCKNLNQVMSICGGQYLTAGLQSLRTVPDNSVDLIFSHAVLEHLRLKEFDETMDQCRRILKPGGVFSNRVDLQDHLGGGLDNLRFSERVWESRLFSRSGFYTNRIRYSAMLSRFERAGFTVVMTRAQHWPQLPIKRRKLDPSFSGLSDDELAVSGFDVVLK